MITRRCGTATIIAVSLLWLNNGSFAAGKNHELFQDTFDAFGTLVSISIYGMPKKTARTVSTAVISDLNRMHGFWHPWQPGPLARINKLLATGGKFYYPPSNLPLFDDSFRFSSQSGGLFNPAIGAFIKLWGFHDASHLPDKPPSEQAIADLLKKNPRFSDVVVDGLQMYSKNTAVILDFGGFAKGVAVDKAVLRLREFGAQNAIVNAGGDLRAFGKHGERPWVIGIRHPRANGVIASVRIRGDESVFTSGDYERFFKYHGKRYHHIIDPRTGYPARGSISVTVITESAGKADAAATALFVAGPKQWRAIAKAMAINQVMLIDDQKQIHMSKAMAERITFEMPLGSYRIVEPPP